MNGYDLSRNWFNWAFENPEKVKPIHSAIFFFAVEHQNRLGGKEKFGFPSQMTMDAIGVKKYQTYGKALKDLCDWGFIFMVEKSKNQYSANIISLVAPLKKGIARGKALDKATIKHGSKQGQSTGQSTDSIDKPLTNKPINQEPITINDDDVLITIEKCKEKYLSDERLKKAIKENLKIPDLETRLTDFNKHLETQSEYSKKWSDYTSHFRNWHKKNKIIKNNNSPTSNLVF